MVQAWQTSWLCGAETLTFVRTTLPHLCHVRAADLVPSSPPQSGNDEDEAKRCEDGRQDQADAAEELAVASLTPSAATYSDAPPLVPEMEDAIQQTATSMCWLERLSGCRPRACTPIAKHAYDRSIGWGSGGVKGNREGCAQLKGRTFFVLPSCGFASGNRSGKVLDFRHAPLSGDRLGVPRRDRLDGHRPDDADCGGQSPAPAAIPGQTHGPEGGDAGLR